MGEVPVAGRDADPEALLTLGKELGRKALKGRSGLGALRHHESVAADTVRLILESSIFEHEPQLGAFPYVIGLDPGDFFHFMGRRGYGRGRLMLDLVGGALGRPSSFDPRPMWALFWALVKAEHEFLGRFVPFWSNEERLTGHLVSQLVERMEEFAPHWTRLTEPAGEAAKSTRCEIRYFDTATARQEKVTGADLGLIVHAEFPWHDEFFKVARFQAKKADSEGKAAIDLDQLQPLMSADHLGHYLFYHQLREEPGTPCPTVRAAQDFQGQLDSGKQQPPGPRGKLGTVTVDALGEGWDFASFITFGLADPSSKLGAMRPNAGRAVSALFGDNAALGMASRVLVVTLGSPPAVDWGDTLGEWTRGG